jgi:hypothetical protein
MYIFMYIYIYTYIKGLPPTAADPCCQKTNIVRYNERACSRDIAETLKDKMSNVCTHNLL